MNFKNLVKVEVLSGFEHNESSETIMTAPIWKLMTQDVYNQAVAANQNILCRLVPYHKPLYGINRYEFMELPIYTEHFIVDFSVAPIATIPTAEGAEDQVFDTSPFLEPDSQEELPGGQTTEEAEALVGEEGGAFGVGIQTGLSAGAFTELGMGGLVGGAAGGPDEGTGGGFNPSLGTGGSGTGNPGVLGGPVTETQEAESLPYWEL